MKEITAWKASKMLRSEQDPEDVILKIEGDVSDHVPKNTSFSWKEDGESFYVDQAMAVLEALDQLPQGTRYRLLILMIESAPIFYRGR